MSLPGTEYKGVRWGRKPDTHWKNTILEIQQIKCSSKGMSRFYYTRRPEKCPTGIKPQDFSLLEHKYSNKGMCVFRLLSTKPQPPAADRV